MMPCPTLDGGDAAALLRTLPDSISEMLAASVREGPHRLAVTDETGRWTYADLAAGVDAAMAVLAENGLGSGMRVLLLGENRRATVAMLLAVLAAGAWAVPLNPRMAQAELDGIRDHADAFMAVYCLDEAPQVRAHAARYGADLIDVPGVGRIGLERIGGGDQVAAANGRVAVLIYTSGSSGTPKGVMLTHRNLLFMAAASGAVRTLGPADRLYLVLPLSHIVGLAVILLGGLLHGATVQLASQFRPRELFRALAEDGVTILLGTPALLTFLLDHARTRPAPSTPRLRIVSVSGAPLDQATKVRAEALFGLTLHHGYGITECAPTIAQTRPEAPRSDCSVGRLLPGMQARLVDPASGLAARDTGELHVRGPNIMLGYFRAEEETARLLDRDGWFNTGDLARVEDGHLFIVGRTKEMVIRFGFNVYPAEIEAVLVTHPGVRACAVVGHSDGGEEQLIAFVEPLPGRDVTAERLMRHAAEHLASYKRPSRLVLLPALPMTLSGKVRKSELMQLACVPA